MGENKSRLASAFTADRITAAFTVVLALSTLALVAVVWLQHGDSIDAIEATKRLAVATENADLDRRQISSAELVLKYDETLNGARYSKIITAIETHPGNYALPSGKIKGKARLKDEDADVDEYIGIFEDIGGFIDYNLITGKMAYDHFSYDVEKAWCNADVQRVVREARAEDRSATASANPMYGDFEKLAREYLAKEDQSCPDLDHQ